MRQASHSTSRGERGGLPTHTHSHTTSHTLNHKLTHSDNIAQGSQKFLCGSRLSCRFVRRIPFHSHPSSRFVSRSPFIVEQFARFTWMKAIAKILNPCKRNAAQLTHINANTNTQAEDDSSVLRHHVSPQQMANVCCYQTVHMDQRSSLIWNAL